MFWLWLLLYGLLFAVRGALAPAAAPLLTPALLAVYWAVLLRGLHTRGRLRSYGLCRGRGLTARDALLSLPVLLFAALNAAFGGARPEIAETVYLLFAVFGEEVLFRGVLPAVWGEKLGAAGAAAASAALFALLHLGSAIGGSFSAAAVQTLCAFGVFLLIVALTRYVSAGSLGAAVTLPFFIMLTTPCNPVIWGSVIAICLLAIWRHAPNIKRLMNHTESKISLSKKK